LIELGIQFLKVHPFVVNKSKKKFDVYIGRPSKWGNPFSHKDKTLAKYKAETHEESILKFNEWVRSQPEFIKEIKAELKGKVLGCYCSPALCHGHILAWIANFEE
jgi:hypothetical protein